MSHKPPWMSRDIWEKCRRKEPIPTREQAQERLNTLRSLPKTEAPERLEIYPCDEGLGPHFHVGHRRKEAA